MHPVKQPTLTGSFPLTDMPAGLMAALVTRLADPLLIRRVVRRVAVLDLAPARTRATRWAGAVSR
jgi:hypothetical protein